MKRNSFEIYRAAEAAAATTTTLNMFQSKKEYGTSVKKGNCSYQFSYNEIDNLTIPILREFDSPKFDIATCSPLLKLNIQGKGCLKKISSNYCE